jgi:glycerophosphoryl diester phosphodiesterase
MNIICHRGYWRIPEEKNTTTSFKRAFELGLGTETDLRDFNGEIVVSHDPPKNGVMTFRDFLKFVPRNLPLALNIKSDGIAEKASAELISAEHHNFFFFDMSIPDMQLYVRRSLPVAVRLSEYEPIVESLIIQGEYIWLDMFHSQWYGVDEINNLINLGKQVFIVSEELHGRDRGSHWDFLENFKHSDLITLCTDFPVEALTRFS